jgi:hypothetical protein
MIGAPGSGSLAPLAAFNEMWRGFVSADRVHDETGEVEAAATALRVTALHDPRMRRVLRPEASVYRSRQVVRGFDHGDVYVRDRWKSFCESLELFARSKGLQKGKRRIVESESVRKAQMAVMFHGGF